MKKIVLLLLMVWMPAALAKDLGVFTDHSGGAGSHSIRIYQTDAKLLIAGYGFTWEYHTSSAPTASIYIASDGSSAEVLGEDSVLWKLRHKYGTDTRLLLKVKSCR